MEEEKFPVISLNTVAWMNFRSHRGFETETYWLSDAESGLLARSAMRFIREIGDARSSVEVIKIRPQIGGSRVYGYRLGGVQIEIILKKVSSRKTQCTTEVELTGDTQFAEPVIIERMMAAVHNELEKLSSGAASEKSRIDRLIGHFAEKK